MGQKSRGNGEGNIRKKADGRWEARVTVGRTEDGKQKMKYFYGHTREEAAAKLNDFLYQNQHGAYIEPSKYTVAQWLDEWYNNYVINSVKTSTRVSYETIIRQHLKPYLGHYMLKDLKSCTIQSVYKELYKSGRIIQKSSKQQDDNQVNKGLSEKTIKNIHLVLRKALQVAYLNDMIPKNPAADGRVTLPEAPKKKDIRVFTLDEQKAIEKACKGERWGMIIMLDLYSGMRQGEILALTWKDIDFQQRTITINKQLSRLKNFNPDITGKTVLAVQPYTKNSKDRVISISPAVVDMLQVYKAAEDSNKMKWAETYEDNDLVFSREDGHFVEPKTFQRYFKKVLVAAGVADRNVHAMRHTFATRALEAGIPVKVVSQILGHSNIQITLDTYSHVLPELQDEAMKKITDTFLEPFQGE